MAPQQEIEMVRRVNNLAERLIEQFGTPISDAGGNHVHVTHESDASFIVKLAGCYIFEAPLLGIKNAVISDARIIGATARQCFEALGKFEEFAKADAAFSGNEEGSHKFSHLRISRGS